jgi:hypothetical protein
VAVSQEQMVREFAAKLQAAEQDILATMPSPQPAVAPVHKPASPPLQR